MSDTFIYVVRLLLPALPLEAHSRDTSFRSCAINAKIHENTSSSDTSIEIYWQAKCWKGIGNTAEENDRINLPQGRTQRAREFDGVDDFDVDDGSGGADLLGPAAGTVATAAAIVGATTMTGVACSNIDCGCRECSESLRAAAGSGRRDC